MFSPKPISAVITIACLLFNVNAHALSARKATSSPSNSTSNSTSGGTFTNARFTFYDAGLGACGKTNVASDLIVALKSDQFGSGYPGPHCFEKIRISYNGKESDATIMDECPGCPHGALDLSRGLFKLFASEDVGVIYGSWSFAGGTDPDGKSGNTNTTTNNEPPSSGDGCEDDPDPEDDGCDDGENGPTSTSPAHPSQSPHTRA